MYHLIHHAYLTKFGCLHLTSILPPHRIVLCISMILLNLVYFYYCLVVALAISERSMTYIFLIR